MNQGTGKMTFTDGGSYDGEWEAGVPHGHGESVTASGDNYVG